jgi:hypothetical protein
MDYFVLYITKNVSSFSLKVKVFFLQKMNRVVKEAQMKEINCALRLLIGLNSSIKHLDYKKERLLHDDILKKTSKS